MSILCCAFLPIILYYLVEIVTSFIIPSHEVHATPSFSNNSLVFCDDRHCYLKI